ncbi:DUF4815 domain-containing protein [Diaphorobacter sp. HDW4A]|nr:DUF4815 domain-containing protein [Diaphorobacter sp. HDW4A]
MTIYNGFDAAKGYTKVLVHADRVAGSAEQNEAQSIIDHRITRIADVLFADGDITEGARCTVNAETGECSMEAGGIYISGAVHDLAAASLQVPSSGWFMWACSTVSAWSRRWMIQRCTTAQPVRPGMVSLVRTACRCPPRGACRAMASRAISIQYGPSATAW